MQLKGWILDLYPSRSGMTLWLIDRSQKHYKLTDSFSPAFYAAGPEESRARLQKALRASAKSLACATVERADLWENRIRPVLQITVRHPLAYTGWARWAEDFDSQLQFFNSDLLPAALYCWEKKIFPLAYVETETDEEGRVQALECRDDEWALDYELPPLRILQIRLAGISSGSAAHGRRAALEIEIDGDCCEIEESDGPVAPNFARLLQRHDPDVILSEGGDSLILPQLHEQARRLHATLPLNRDAAAEIQQSRPRSFISYGRILFKDATTTLFGRLHVDRKNSFISGKCDLTGLWELARVTKLPVQYAARTTTGTGISYMQMELAYRDGVLIPGQKAEPEDPKQPDEMMASDRGGLVFVPPPGFFPDVCELDFSSEYPSIMARFNISPETINCACCPDAPRIPELGYRICQKRRGINSRVVERLIAKRKTCKQQMREAGPKAKSCQLQRDALKWLLVCCFGYTGYRNARFGKIEAHEAINAVAREALLTAKEEAERSGFRVLHALVDSLFVQRPGASRKDYEQLARKIEEITRLPIEVEAVYRYVVFLPSRQFADLPVPNRFFAVPEEGTLKVRGLETRRHDTPPLISRMQQEALAIVAEAHDYDSYLQKLEEAHRVLERYCQQVADGSAAIEDLVISKRITREPREYQKSSLTAIAAQQLLSRGVKLRPGETIQYIILDSEASVPNDRARAFALWEGWHGYDRAKYRALLREAFEPFLIPAPPSQRPGLARKAPPVLPNTA